MPAWKLDSMADVIVETGFLASLGQNADWNIF